MRLPPAESVTNGSSGGSTTVRGPFESRDRGALEQIAPGIATRLLHAECARGGQSVSACASAIVVSGFVFDHASVRVSITLLSDFRSRFCPSFELAGECLLLALEGGPVTARSCGDGFSRTSRHAICMQLLSRNVGDGVVRLVQIDGRPSIEDTAGLCRALERCRLASSCVLLDGRMRPCCCLGAHGIPDGTGAVARCGACSPHRPPAEPFPEAPRTKSRVRFAQRTRSNSRSSCPVSLLQRMGRSARIVEWLPARPSDTLPRRPGHPLTPFDRLKSV